MSVFLDEKGRPAVLLSFGYCFTEAREDVASVLAVRKGRVVVHKCSHSQFEQEYLRAPIPFKIAVLALGSIARSEGQTLEARRHLLWLAGAPRWKQVVVELLIRMLR